MPYFAISAVISFVVAAIAAMTELGNSIMVAHCIFALGIVPLIFAAMLHFVPVLTRTPAPSRTISCLPYLVQIAGILVVLGLSGQFANWSIWLITIAASLDVMCAVLLWRWQVQRARETIGSPHPGWRWYAVALWAFILAVLAIVLMLLLSLNTSNANDYLPALRYFHIHLNPLGFIGLTAVGTLLVLLPTSVKQSDPRAKPWLQEKLWAMAGAVLVLALGAAITGTNSLAWFGLTVAVGAGLVLVCLIVEWLWHCHRLFGKALYAPGAAPSLLVASIAFVGQLIFGVLHGIQGVQSVGMHGGVITTALIWVIAFLLPLVSGALTQLLPLWLYPGLPNPDRTRWQTYLAWGSRQRAVVLLLLGVGLSLLHRCS